MAEDRIQLTGDATSLVQAYANANAAANNYVNTIKRVGRSEDELSQAAHARQMKLSQAEGTLSNFRKKVVKDVVGVEAKAEKINRKNQENRAIREAKMEVKHREALIENSKFDKKIQDKQAAETKKRLVENTKLLDKHRVDQQKKAEKNRKFLNRLRNKEAVREAAAKKTAARMELRQQAKENMNLTWQSLGRLVIVQSLHRAFSALSRSIVEGVKATSQLSIKLAELQTISQNQQLTIPDWLSGITGQSNIFGIDAFDQVEAAYQTLSNQIAEGAETFKFLGQANRFAVTALASSTEAVNLLSATINAYSMRASEAEKISASWFKTIELGRLRASEIADSIGDVAVMAEQSGAGLHELQAAISTMTIRGIKSNKVMTQLRGIFVKLLKPTKEMKKFLRGIGAESGEAAIKLHGFGEFMRLLQEYTHGSSTELAKIISRIRGLTGALVFKGEGLEEYERNLEEIVNGLDDYQNATDRIMASSGKQFEIHMMRIKNFFREDIGMGFLTTLTKYPAVLSAVEVGVKSLTKLIIAGTIPAIVGLGFAAKKTIGAIVIAAAPAAAYASAIVAMVIVIHRAINAQQILRKEIRLARDEYIESLRQQAEAEDKFFNRTLDKVKRHYNKRLREASSKLAKERGEVNKTTDKNEDVYNDLFKTQQRYTANVNELIDERISKLKEEVKETEKASDTIADLRKDTITSARETVLKDKLRETDRFRLGDRRKSEQELKARGRTEKLSILENEERFYRTQRDRALRLGDVDDVRMFTQKIRDLFNQREDIIDNIEDEIDDALRLGNKRLARKLQAQLNRQEKGTGTQQQGFIDVPIISGGFDQRGFDQASALEDFYRFENQYLAQYEQIARREENIVAQQLRFEEERKALYQDLYEQYREAGKLDIESALTSDEQLNKLKADLNELQIDAQTASREGLIGLKAKHDLITAKREEINNREQELLSTELDSRQNLINQMWRIQNEIGATMEDIDRLAQMTDVLRAIDISAAEGLDIGADQREIEFLRSSIKNQIAAMEIERGISRKAESEVGGSVAELRRLLQSQMEQLSRRVIGGGFGPPQKETLTQIGSLQDVLDTLDAYTKSQDPELFKSALRSMQEFFAVRGTGETAIEFEVLMNAYKHVEDAMQVNADIIEKGDEVLRDLQEQLKNTMSEEQANTEKLSNAVDVFAETTRTFSVDLERIMSKYLKPEVNRPEVGIIGKIRQFVGYDAKGGPKGSDTVPSWLTPGEFVMSRKGVLGNISTLARMNAGHLKMDQRYVSGGEVKNSNHFTLVSSGSEPIDARRMVHHINREQRRGTAKLGPKQLHF